MSAVAPVSTAALAEARRRTTVVLVITQVIGTIGVGVAPSIGVLLAEQVTQNEAWAGLARTASTLGAALFGIPLGNLAARSGRRIALATGWWTAAVGGTILVAAAQWNLVVPLFVGLFLIGAGSAVSLQARFAAADLAEPHRKARVLALVVWVGTLGSVLGPNLGVPGEIVERLTGLSVFGSAFGIAAVCMGVAGLVIMVTLRPDPLLLSRTLPGAPPSTAGVRSGGRLAQMGAELRTNARARYAVVAIITAQIVMVAVMTMTPVHIAHHGGSVTLVGITISLHVVGMYALAPVVGQLVDRVGARITVLIGLAVFVASLLIGALRPDGTGWIITSLILLGIGWSFVNVAGSALFSAAVVGDHRASAQGGVDAVSNLCGATAAFAAGPLLAVSSFSFLAVVSMVVLVPLGVLSLLPPGRRWVE